jgi:hypothetical protein
MLPSDAKARKETPIYSGFLMYFPEAVAYVAKLSLENCSSLDPKRIVGLLMDGDVESVGEAALIAIHALQRVIDPGQQVSLDGTVGGLVWSFPGAAIAAARLSYIANEQHNPGEPMRWAREKSTDHHDCVVRHLLGANTVDSDGCLHATKVTWRCFAILQLTIEAEREPAVKLNIRALDTVSEAMKKIVEHVGDVANPRTTFWDMPTGALVCPSSVPGM